MSPELALEWLAFATQRPCDDLLRLGLDELQVSKLGSWLAQNSLINPPRPGMKTAALVCGCGCRTRFVAEYRTKKPKYLNNSHKQKAYRKRLLLVSS